MKKALGILVIALIGSAFVVATVVKRTSDKKTSYIKYFMSHPAHDWEGVTNNVNCISAEQDGKIVKVAVTVPVSSFNSQNDSRDSHALEVLEALKYPIIIFSSSKVTYENDTLLNVAGELTFHGVKKLISFKAVNKLANKKRTVNGSFVLKLTDFNVEPPSMMLVSADDEFKVEVNMVFDEK